MVEPRDNVLVVMPAWNESATVARVVLEVRVAQPRATILVVNDGSRDDTASEARSAGARVLELPVNLGVGGAMRAGFRYAVEHSHTAVVQVDADGQHNPADIDTLLSALDDVDLAIGARFAGVGDYAVHGPRLWAMWVLRHALSSVVRTPLTDVTSGFRASGPRAIPVYADNYPAEYLGDTIETLVIARKFGLRVGQVPVAMRERAGGEPSHSPLKAAVYLSRSMLALFVALLRPTRAS